MQFCALRTVRYGAGVGVTSGGVWPLVSSVIAQASCESPQLLCPGGGWRSATHGAASAGPSL